MEDYLYWQDRDKKTIKRIDRLIKDIGHNGCLEGVGKPEPLSGDSTGRSVMGTIRELRRMAAGVFCLSRSAFFEVNLICSLPGRQVK